ncbi:MAG: hypothetical protein ACREL5_12645 [Gemmatimonadales bacterium]
MVPHAITIDAVRSPEAAIRSSHPTQLAAAKATLDARDAMVPEWADWIVERADSRSMPRPLVERQLRLIVDTMVEMLGPLKREARVVWQEVLEHYGRTAAARGLAAGEVVEELQQLRVLLIKYIGGFVAAMRPRRAVAVFLRLNAVVDRGIAHAVVGYTDALVASLMARDGDAHGVLESNSDEIARQLDQLEAELGPLSARR